MILAPGLSHEDINGNGHSDELYLQFEASSPLFPFIVDFFLLQPFNGYHHGLPGDDLLVQTLITLNDDQGQQSTKPNMEISKIKIPPCLMKVSRLLTTMWSNFMWSGNPTECHNSSRVPCQVSNLCQKKKEMHQWQRRIGYISFSIFHCSSSIYRMRQKKACFF